jgi:hypothetical protein
LHIAALPMSTFIVQALLSLQFVGQLAGGSHVSLPSTIPSPHTGPPLDELEELDELLAEDDEDDADDDAEDEDELTEDEPPPLDEDETSPEEDPLLLDDDELATFPAPPWLEPLPAEPPALSPPPIPPLAFSPIVPVQPLGSTPIAPKRSVPIATLRTCSSCFVVRFMKKTPCMCGLKRCRDDECHRDGPMIHVLEKLRREMNAQVSRLFYISIRADKSCRVAACLAGS